MIRSFAKVFGKTRRFPPRRRTAFVVFRGWTGPVGQPPVGPGPVSAIICPDVILSFSRDLVRHIHHARSES